MDDIRRRGPPRYEVVSRRPVAKVTLTWGDTMYTHCEDGVYHAEGLDSYVEEVRSRKTGTRYHRLVLRFRLIDGPYVMDPKGSPVAAGSAVFGRIVPIWQELHLADDGTLQLPTSCWFAAAVMRRGQCRSLAAALEAWVRTIRWVRVMRPARGSRLGPARVCGVAYGESPPLEWISAS